MSFLNSLVKNLNPVKLVSNVVGGTVGKVVGIATNVVTSIAEGKSFGAMMKGVVTDVAGLAIAAAITCFTGGTAGLFVNGLLERATSILGDVAAKVATSALAKPVSSWLSGKITGFAETLTSDWVRGQLTDVVLQTTGLSNEHQRLERSHLEALAGGDWFAKFLQRQFKNNVPASTRAATMGSIQAAMARPVESFEG